jgi:hypothetical protein
METIEEKIKKVVKDELILDESLVDFLVYKINKDPSSVQKLLLFKILYRDPPLFIIERKDIDKIKKITYQTFMEEVKNILAEND